MAFAARAIVSLLAIAFVGATPAPEMSPPASPAPTWCPIAPVLESLDDRRIAIGFWTPFPTGVASGVVTLWTATARYDVRFDDAVVLHHVRAAPDTPAPTPIVLRFPEPVRIESAAVTSLDAPTPGSCDPPYVPWRSQSAILGRDSRSGPSTREYRRGAPLPPVREAPAPTPYAPPQCAVRSALAKTLRAYEPQAMRWNGSVDVLVTVGVDGRAVSVEALHSSGYESVDAVAKDAAARSTYEPEIFDCRKIIGTYVFRVDFSYR